MLEKIKSASSQLKFCLVMPLVLALLYLIGADGTLDYGYYTFIRVISLIMLGIFIFAYYSVRGTLLNFPSIAAIFVMVLFNPIAPIHMSSDTWAVLDVISAISLVAVSIYILKTDISNGSSQNGQK